MARISGVDLPREKRVEIGLTYIYGIGLKSSQKILAQTGINPDTRVKDLTDEEVNKIREVIDAEHTVEGDLRRQLALDIKRLMERIIGLNNRILPQCPFAIHIRLPKLFLGNRHLVALIGLPKHDAPMAASRIERSSVVKNNTFRLHGHPILVSIFLHNASCRWCM